MNQFANGNKQIKISQIKEKHERSSYIYNNSSGSVSGQKEYVSLVWFVLCLVNEK